MELPCIDFSDSNRVVEIGHEFSGLR
jgi:hypothetical protein